MLETSPAPAATAPAFAMPLGEAMRTQRAIRRLKPDPVDDALVLRLIELALKAPTGSNAQNWEFVMVKDRAVKERLGALNRGALRIYRRRGRRAARNTLPLWSTSLARRALGLPWSVTPCAVVPLGWPRGRYGPTTRRPVGDVVHVDRYGNQPYRGRA